jgi:hypothetical protein
MNKTLSKFAHPTAFAVMSLGSEEENFLKEKFKSVGLFLARVGIMFTNYKKAVEDPFPRSN